MAKQRRPDSEEERTRRFLQEITVQRNKETLVEPARFHVVTKCKQQAASEGGEQRCSWLQHTAAHTWDGSLNQDPRHLAHWTVQADRDGAPQNLFPSC